MDRRKALHLMTAAAAAQFGGFPLYTLAASGKVPMTTKTIPSSGEPIPVIGLGTWQTFDVGDSADERAPLLAVLREFAVMGGKLVDSSPMYGRSEEVVGDLIEQLKLQSALFLATKVWTGGKDAGIAQMDSSISKLRANSIDLMQVHNLLDVEAHLATLREWKSKGIVRYIGVTHYTASAYSAVARVLKTYPLDFLQINYSVGEREAEKQLLPLAKERGIAVIANRPFAGGGLFQRVRSRPLPSWAADIDCTSWAQLLLKFVVSHPAVTCTIPATAKIEHLRDNMQAGLGCMPNEKMRALIAAQIS